jgi:hypothetical protein
MPNLPGRVSPESAEMTAVPAGAVSPTNWSAPGTAAGGAGAGIDRGTVPRPAVHHFGVVMAGRDWATWMFAWLSRPQFEGGTLG